MNKIKWTTLILLLSLGTAANAQSGSSSELLSLFSSGDKLVKRALDGSVCLIRQEYNLVSPKTGTQYGRQKKQYFGYVYSVGVITDKGIKASPNTVTPWVGEKLIPQYKDTLRTQLIAVKLRKPGERNFTEVKGILPDTARGLFATYNIADSLKAWKGVSMANTARDSAGWVLIVSIKKDAKLNDTLAITTSVIKADVARKDGLGFYIKNMPAKDQVIGGIYYTCDVTTGKISFSAAGLLQKTDTFWSISFFADQKNKTSNVSNQPAQDKSAEPEDGQLTNAGAPAKDGAPIEKPAQQPPPPKLAKPKKTPQ